jgi:hypothetical protein
MKVELQCSCEFNWLPDVVSLATECEPDQITKPERLAQVAVVVFMMHSGRRLLLHLTAKVSSTPTIPSPSSHGKEIRSEPFKNEN